MIAFTASVSHALKIGKAFVDTRDSAKLGTLNDEYISSMIEVKEKHLAVQEEYETVFCENKKLKAIVAEHDKWEEECDRYERHHPEAGFLVYSLKSEHASGEEPDWICATCYQDRKNSPLHPLKKGEGDWCCPRNSGHNLYMGDSVFMA